MDGARGRAWAECSAEKRLEMLRAEVRRLGAVTQLLTARADAVGKLVERSMRAHGVDEDMIGGVMREILKGGGVVDDPLA